MYVGETRRHLRTRIAEHSQNSRQSTIMGHTVNCGRRITCKPTADEFNIIKSGLVNNLHRKAYEALIIKKEKPPLNVQDDLFLKSLHIFLNNFVLSISCCLFVCVFVIYLFIY